MTKFNSYSNLASLFLIAPRFAMADNLRGKVAFNSNVLKIAVNDWLNNATTASAKYCGHISEWDVSRVQNMSGLFENAKDFNEDLSSWDVSNVRDFQFAFANATSFAGNLSSWDTSNVKYMKHMFHGASSFNSNLSNWNTTNVMSFAYMFAGASAFNGSIATWDVTNSYDLSFMFYNATSFNEDVSEWTIEHVTEGGFRVKWTQNFQSMFQGASSFDGDLSKWQTYAAYNMNSMFKDASSFSGDLSSWDVRHVEDFGEMFVGSKFNQDLCWDVQAGANITNMFDGTFGSLSTNCKKEKRRITPDVTRGVPDSTNFSASPFIQVCTALAIPALALVALVFQPLGV